MSTTTIPGVGTTLFGVSQMVNVSPAVISKRMKKNPALASLAVKLGPAWVIPPQHLGEFVAKLTGGNAA